MKAVKLRTVARRVSAASVACEGDVDVYITIQKKLVFFHCICKKINNYLKYLFI